MSESTRQPHDVPPTVTTDHDRGPNLSAFLMAHNAMRTEFGRLADALDHPRDGRHRALLHDQIAFVLTVLHHHHTDEDDWIWPTLTTRVPNARPTLEALEHEHQHIDPDLAIAGDITRPDTERIDALRRLHHQLGDHLDHEERDAVPLMRQAFTRDEWAHHEEGIIKSYDRAILPTLFGWVSACSNPSDVQRALTDFPLPVRLLFRVRWWPAYRRRHEDLYGTPIRRHPTRT